METKTKYRHKKRGTLITQTGSVIDRTCPNEYTLILYNDRFGRPCACRSIEFFERYEIAKEIPDYCDLCDSLVRLHVGKTILFKCGKNGRRIGSAIGCLTVCPTPGWCGKENVDDRD